MCNATGRWETSIWFPFKCFQYSISSSLITYSINSFWAICLYSKYLFMITLSIRPSYLISLRNVTSATLGSTIFPLLSSSISCISHRPPIATIYWLIYIFFFLLYLFMTSLFISVLFRFLDIQLSHAIIIVSKRQSKYRKSKVCWTYLQFKRLGRSLNSSIGALVMR